jgi:GT2 family glycosyltransferase
MPPRVYVVVLNWNNWRDTIECLESLGRLDYPAFEIVVCDNASTDGSVAMIERWARGEIDAPCRSADASIVGLTQPPIAKPIPVRKMPEDDEAPAAPATAATLTIIELAANRGYAAGNNAGLRYAQRRGDAAFVWILNNDTVVEPAALSALVERCGRDPRIGICGSRLMRYDLPDRVQAAGGAVYRPAIAIPSIIGAGEPVERLPPPAEIERRMSYVVGASMLVGMAFVRQVGAMSEDYFLYFEELDWAMRAGDRFAQGYAPGSVVYHKEGGSAGSSDDWRLRSEISDLCAIRNRLLVTRRYFTAWYPLVFATIVAAFFRRLLRRQPERARQILRILAAPESYRLPRSERAQRSGKLPG